MPHRVFTRSRKAWYDTVNQTNNEPEEFMLALHFENDTEFEEGLGSEFGIRYHPAVAGWRVEAYDDSVLLLPHFSDVISALGAKDACFDGDGLEALFIQAGILDKTARAIPEHIKGHPGLKP